MLKRVERHGVPWHYNDHRKNELNLFTFKSGGSSGYFSVCEKIKPNSTAREFSEEDVHMNSQYLR